MPPIKELDPELAWKAIEGFTNELAPEQKTLDAFYRQFTCKLCGSPCRKETLNSRHAFSDPDVLVPRSVLRCTLCTCLFDPHTGILLERGDPEKASGISIIRPRGE